MAVPVRTSQKVDGHAPLYHAGLCSFSAFDFQVCRWLIAIALPGFIGSLRRPKLHAWFATDHPASDTIQSQRMIRVFPFVLVLSETSHPDCPSALRMFFCFCYPDLISCEAACGDISKCCSAASVVAHDFGELILANGMAVRCCQHARQYIDAFLIMSHREDQSSFESIARTNQITRYLDLVTLPWYCTPLWRVHPSFG